MLIPDEDVDMLVANNPGKLTGETESEKTAEHISTRGSRRKFFTRGSRRGNIVVTRGSRRRSLELNLREQEEGGDDPEHDMEGSDSESKHAGLDEESPQNIEIFNIGISCSNFPKKLSSWWDNSTQNILNKIESDFNSDVELIETQINIDKLVEENLAENSHPEFNNENQL